MNRVITFFCLSLATSGFTQNVFSAVYKEQINARWSDDGRTFWYRNDLSGGKKEFIRVDAGRGLRTPAFDHGRLADSLSSAGVACESDRLPFTEVQFSGDGSEVLFDVNGTKWECSLDRYELRKSSAKLVVPQKTAEVTLYGDEDSIEDGAERSASPDGKWIGWIKDHNVVVSSAAGGSELRLSSDGREKDGYRRVSWSPDSKVLVSFRVAEAEQTEVYLVESSPKGGGPAHLHRRVYPVAGDKFDSFELNLFDVATGKQLKHLVDPIDFGVPHIHWLKDNRHFTYQKVDRGHQRFRLIEVDAVTGQSRELIDEKSDTFIWTAHTENLGVRKITWLAKSDEAIFSSEQSGWRHLYLVNAVKGGSPFPITSGNYVVRGLEWIDEEKREIWFHGSGGEPGQDPYFIHHYRVNFDGTGLVRLTEGNGNHTVRYSPTREFLIDTWSRVDAAPVHQLRRSSDGSLVCQLEEADISDLKATGWQAPEVFNAKGRDGTTDIWGIIVKPADFDASKKYPVIERIYAGPQGFYTPKSFSPNHRTQALADKGFILVMMDAMGTAMRSKAFHDICWKNLKDAGFPDRILWMKAAAAERPYMDLERVGIFGGSAGGQNAGGAVLFHPEFYKVAVASCGCHDNRMDKASWNEQWMGYPVGTQYSDSSNIDNAARLAGKLMLVVGELDDNVPPESTYRFADALIKSGKDFELVMVPGENHGDGGAYGIRRREDFFIKHLLHRDSPDRNVAPSTPPASR